MCLVAIVLLSLVMPCGCLQFVIVVFPDPEIEGKRRTFYKVSEYEANDAHFIK